MEERTFEEKLVYEEELILDSDKWQIDGLQESKDRSYSCMVKKNKSELLFENKDSKKITFSYCNPLNCNEKKIIYAEILCRGRILQNSGGCLYLNGYPIPLDGKSGMPLNPPIKLNFSVTINSCSSLEISDVVIRFYSEEKDLADACGVDKNILVVTPDYPSANNLYLCAFVHSRCRAYVQAGLSVQVAALSDAWWYQSVYEIDGVPVLVGSSATFKKLISRKQYDAIVIHFVGEEHYQILDGYITNEQLVFICHGPETTFPILPNKCRPYFTKPMSKIVEIRSKKKYVQKYAKKENVTWVFVSNWLKQEAEKLMEVSFKNSCCIGNLIDEKLFPYVPKKANDRKRILILRKFDNIRVHSIDQSVLAILELSRRPFFSDLTIDVYGDGNYFDELTYPLRQFPNVHLYRTFIPNGEISEIHKAHGILLIPSRHDAQAVSMSEGASSGLVVVGSAVTSNGYYMDNGANHTLVDPEDPEALAGVIERLYYHPDEFLGISRRLSNHVHSICGRTQTIEKEIALIREKAATAQASRERFPQIYPDWGDGPVLTILVPAYNVEDYISKCLHSLISHRNVGKTEILVVNDGSTDVTSEIAHQYEAAAHGVIRVIDKENGGHGSTINTGIAQAKGKYFRIIDGDDWVDSESLAELVGILENEDSDIVLTKGCYEYVEKAGLTNIIDYDMLTEGVKYHFDDLLYPDYGFNTYGPLLTTGNYKTECLRKAGFTLSEKKPYVDMEFNSFSQRYIDTLRYYDLDIYRYLIGREGQTVSRGFWKKKYQDHRYIIFNVLNTLDRMGDFPRRRKEYIYMHLIAMMVDSQIFMYDQLCLWNEIDPFLDELGKWPEAKKYVLEYVIKKDDASKKILEHYRGRLKWMTPKKPLINSDGSMDRPQKGLFWIVKKAMKAVVPYGAIRIYQKIRYNI